MNIQIILIRTVIWYFLLFDLVHAMDIAIFQQNHPVLYRSVKHLQLTQDDYQSLSEYVNETKFYLRIRGIEGICYQYSKYSTMSNNQLFYSWVVYKKLVAPKLLKRQQSNPYYISLFWNNNCNDPKKLSFVLKEDNCLKSFFYSQGYGFNLDIVMLNAFPDFNNLIKSFAKTEYTIYLYTSLDSFCQTLWIICSLLEQNPHIKDNIYLKNIISGINIYYECESENGSEKTYLALSIARLFCPEGKDMESLTADDIKNGSCWDYKKSKHYLELALVFFQHISAITKLLHQ